MFTAHRLTALGSVVALAVAALLSRAVLRGGRPPVAPNTCEATWSVSLGTDPEALPRALIAAGRDVWAAVTLGGDAQLVRTRDGRRHQGVQTVRGVGAVRGWFSDAGGVHLALGGGARVRVVTAGGGERTVAASEVPAPQADTSALGAAVAGRDALARAVVALDAGRVVLWTTRDGPVTTLRYRLLDARDNPAGAAGTLGELLATPDARHAPVVAAAQAGPREAAMALATSHGPRMVQLRCGAAR